LCLCFYFFVVFYCVGANAGGIGMSLYEDSRSLWFDYGKIKLMRLKAKAPIILEKYKGPPRSIGFCCHCKVECLFLFFYFFIFLFFYLICWYFFWFFCIVFFCIVLFCIFL
jgi:hypothetical protein